MRVGFGYDVHRLVEGRKLVLGGTEIPFEKGLLGHSDADVLLHAIIDALLGAAGREDIGSNFPDTDERYRGISSMVLLENTMDMIRRDGYKVSNIDATVVIQEPRIRPYTRQMCENISSVLGIDASCVSVKAKTTEGLGFVGTGEGVTAYAVALLD